MRRPAAPSASALATLGRAMRAYRSPPRPRTPLFIVQRVLLLAAMVLLLAMGVVYWLALLSVGRSAAGAVSGIGQWLVPAQVTAIPRQGATFKKSPLDSDLSTPTLAPLLAPPPAAETAAPADAPTPAPSPPPAAPTDSPAAEATPTSAPTAAPADGATPTAAPTDSPAAEASPTPQGGRAPRLAQPIPQPGSVVTPGAQEFSVRVRADARLEQARAALDGEGRDVAIDPLGESAWLVHFTASVSAGPHRVWLRARDAEGREGSFAWEFDAR